MGVLWQRDSGRLIGAGEFVLNVFSETLTR